MHDVINHPLHYTLHPTGIECFDVIKGMPHELSNPVKYTFRTDLKNGIEDLNKAIWYLKKCDEETFRLLEHYYNPVMHEFINQSFEIKCDRMPAYICQAAKALDFERFEDQIDGCIYMIENRIERMLEA